MSDIITRTSPAIEAIYAVASDLRDLARAFSITGNDTVAESLFANANHLQDQAESISAAISERIDGDLRAAQENSATLLSAVMAGLTMRKES